MKNLDQQTIDFIVKSLKLLKDESTVNDVFKVNTEKMPKEIQQILSKLSVKAWDSGFDCAVQCIKDLNVLNTKINILRND